MRLPIVLLFTVAAGVFGFSAGLLSRAPERVAPAMIDATPTRDVAVAGGSNEVQLDAPGLLGRTPLSTSGPPRNEPAEAESQGLIEVPLFSASLLAHHANEFNSGWKSVRAQDAPTSAMEQGEAEFRYTTLHLSRKIGKREAEGLNKEEAAGKALQDGSAVGILLAIEKGVWKPPEGFVNGEEFAGATLARSGGGAIDGEDLMTDKSVAIENGSVISFGPGIHKLDERSFRDAGRGNVPMDVTIIGAGKNSTLLRIGDISSGADIVRLTFRNMTLDANNDGLFDQRSGSLSLHLESARVVRFDARHGGCYIFSASNGCAVTAVDTEFTGGYGRSPGTGYFLRSEPFLGHFKNCTLELVDLRNLKQLDSGQVHFKGCRFVIRGEDPRAWKNALITMVGCSYEAIPVQAKDLQKDLTNLFPQLR